MLKYKPVGDSAIQVIFGDIISESISMKIQSFIRELEDIDHKLKHGILECVPAYTTLTLYYDPVIHHYTNLLPLLQSIEARLGDHDRSFIPYVIEIPTLYGGEYGPDLNEVACFHHLSTQEIIEIHSAKPYLIYMLGFSPGFPYLGGMSKKIATPRLSNPRAEVLSGSVGIAGEQTGIYSIDSPGGWRIIGRTPLRLYDPQKQNPFLLEAGHYLKFVPIDEDKYKEVERKLNNKEGIDVRKYPYSEH